MLEKMRIRDCISIKQIIYISCLYLHTKTVCGESPIQTLNRPIGLWSDSIGNLYFADSLNYCVRYLSQTTQSMETVAGITGFNGWNGNLDSPATSTLMSNTYGIVTDSSDNLLIADYVNGQIVKVNHDTKILSTIIGRDQLSDYVDDIPATSAMLKYPASLWFDTSSNLYLSDAGNFRVRKVDHNTNIINTLCGTGILSPTNGDNNMPGTAINIGQIFGIWTDSVGMIYFSDNTRYLIRRMDETTGIVNIFAGVGIANGQSVAFNGDQLPATSTYLLSNAYLWGSTLHEIYFADIGNQRARKIDSVSIVHTVAGNGVAGYETDDVRATSTKLYNPYAVSGDSNGQLYIADTLNHLVRKFDSTVGIITSIAGTVPYLTPTKTPSIKPTAVPVPTTTSSVVPSVSQVPSRQPTSIMPSTIKPTLFPTVQPTQSPTSSKVGNTLSLVVLITPFAMFFVYWYWHKRQTRIEILKTQENNSNDTQIIQLIEHHSADIEGGTLITSTSDPPNKYADTLINVTTDYMETVLTQSVKVKPQHNEIQADAAVNKVVSTTMDGSAKRLTPRGGRVHCDATEKDIEATLVIGSHSSKTGLNNSNTNNASFGDTDV